MHFVFAAIVTDADKGINGTEAGGFSEGICYNYAAAKKPTGAIAPVGFLYFPAVCVPAGLVFYFSRPQPGLWKQVVLWHLKLQESEGFWGKLFLEKLPPNPRKIASKHRDFAFCGKRPKAPHGKLPLSIGIRNFSEEKLIKDFHLFSPAATAADAFRLPAEGNGHDLRRSGGQPVRARFIR